MYYASVCLIILIHHIIINFDLLRNGKKEKSSGFHYRYRQFLFVLFVFYLADFLWGIIEFSGSLILLYANTMTFFASMAMCVLFWTRYVVAFLDKHGTKAKAFLAAGWVIFGFVIFHLIVNFFNPSIFEFTDDAQYIPKMGREILMFSQLLLFVVISLYSLLTSKKSKGRDRVHYVAVGASGGVMAIFTALQIYDPFSPFYSIGCFFANSLIHVFVEEDEKNEQNRITEETRKEKETYSRVAAGLAEEYEAIYYVELETGKYMEISSSESYKSLNVPDKGDDFYTETRKNAARYAHPDDREFAESMYYKDEMKKKLEERGSYSYQYRIMSGDVAKYYRFDVKLSKDGKYFVLCDKDIHDTLTAETEKQKARVTFGQIAESLASNYDVIYYVEIETGKYSGFTAQNIYGELEINESGNDFFSECKKNIELMLHPDDKEEMFSVLNKDYLLAALDRRKQFTYQYRHVVGGRIEYTRFTARKSSDGRHMIICVENIDDEVKKEKEHLRALNMEKELARRDELTGMRNKTAFLELEKAVQDNIDKGMDYLRFAIVVSDLNNLKIINDTKGHNAGDEYIRSAAKLLGDIFDHSPIFRIGGDEFVIFLSGEDYFKRDELVEKLHKEVISNRDNCNGPVMAVGISEYEPSSDIDVNEIFDRADSMMYDDKRKLKGIASDGSV